MDDSSRKTRGPSRTRTSATRTAAVIVATAILALLAACAARPSSTGTGAPEAAGPTNSPSAVAYSTCMRSHGVPNFPDPPPGNPGAVAKANPQQLGVGTAQLQSAQQACKQLIPATGSNAEQQQETQCAMAGSCSSAVVQQWMSGLRTLAACLRTHGVPNWPDPVLTAQGIPHFPYDQAGIDHHSSQTLAKVKTCVTQTGFQGLPLP
jgi:hypothetical protein